MTESPMPSDTPLHEILAPLLGEEKCPVKCSDYTCPISHQTTKRWTTRGGTYLNGDKSVRRNVGWWLRVEEMPQVPFAKSLVSGKWVASLPDQVFRDHDPLVCLVNAWCRLREEEA